MVKELQKIKTLKKIIRIKAVDGYKLKNKVQYVNSSSPNLHKITPGAIGVALSQVRLWIQKLFYENQRAILVFDTLLITLAAFLINSGINCNSKQSFFSSFRFTLTETITLQTFPSKSYLSK